MLATKYITSTTLMRNASCWKSMPTPGHDVHLGRACPRSCPGPGQRRPSTNWSLVAPAGQLLADDSGEDHVHRLAQDPRGDDVEDDGDRHHGEHGDDAGALRASAGPSAAWPRARSAGPSWPARSPNMSPSASPGVYSSSRSHRRSRRLRRSARLRRLWPAWWRRSLGAHATASALSWDSTISW